jgi:hypothetical protein
MARNTDKRAASFESENTGGLLSGFLAEEDASDRRTLWRLGSWGAASVGAVILAVYANQSSIAVRREQVAAAADLAQQAQQIQSVAKESQSEARRLASAIETLNGDRDRLYARVTVLEQGLETVTGAIAKQPAAAAASPPPASTTATAPASDPQPPAQKQPPAQNPAPTPVVSPVATTAPKAADKPSPVAAAAPEPAPATVASVAQKPSNPPATTTPPAIAPAPPLVAAKSMMGPPDAAASKLIEPDKPETPEKPEKLEKSEKPAKAITATPMPEVVASAPSAADAASYAAKTTSPKLAVQRTEFGIDVGGANSVGGLRALWRGLLKSRSNAALTTLRPIIVIKEGSNGLGMQLRLVAGPLDDAAAAAKICAGLVESDRTCVTTVFDGQRLALNADEPAATGKPVAEKPVAEKPAIENPAIEKPVTAKPATARPFAHRRGYSKRVMVEEPAKKPDPPSALSSFFRRQN